MASLSLFNHHDVEWGKSPGHLAGECDMWRNRDSFDCHNVATVGYKYMSLFSFERVLACEIEDAAREPFAGDYYSEVIPLYGWYRVE